MDYGKNAYMRADDLARRVDALERKNITDYGVSQYSSTTRREVAGRLVLSRRLVSDADGGIAAVIRLRFASFKAGALLVSVKAQDRIAANDRYALGTGEQDVFLMAHATIEEGNANIEIVLEGNTTLLGYDLMVFGKGMRGAEDGMTLSTVGNYACVHTAGCAYLYNLDAPDEAIESVLCGIGVLCGAREAPELYFCDRGIAWRRKWNGVVEFVADRASHAIGLDEGVALVRDGAAYVMNRGATIRVPAGSEQAVSILLVAKSQRGAFLLRTASDKIYYKERAPQVSAASLRMGGNV